MWTKVKRQSFREAEETRQKILRWTESLKEAKVTYELMEVQISGKMGRAKRKVTIVGRGERHEGIDYEHWVFEKGDWYIDEVGRTD